MLRSVVSWRLYSFSGLHMQLNNNTVTCCCAYKIILRNMQLYIVDLQTFHLCTWINMMYCITNLYSYSLEVHSLPEQSKFVKELLSEVTALFLEMKRLISHVLFCMYVIVYVHTSKFVALQMNTVNVYFPG